MPYNPKPLGFMVRITGRVLLGRLARPSPLLRSRQRRRVLYGLRLTTGFRVWTSAGPPSQQERCQAGSYAAGHGRPPEELPAGDSQALRAW